MTAHLMVSILERMGFLHATSPSMEKSLRFADVYPVDLFIVDVNLPDGTGLELTRRIRNRKYAQHAPVLICSGLTDRRTVKEALSLGVADFCTKPLDARELSLRLERILSKSERPWEPWGDVLTRLGISSDQYREMLGRAEQVLVDVARELEDTVQPGLGNSRLDQLRSLAGSIGLRALGRVLDQLGEGTPSDLPGEEVLASALRREARRIGLLLGTSDRSAGSLLLAMPEEDEPTDSPTPESPEPAEPAPEQFRDPPADVGSA